MSPSHAPKAVERFIFFSDAVFAFSLTLLAASLKLPPHADRLSHAELLAALGEMVPVLTCYLITFGVVARLWARHHRTFERLHDYDDRLILLNFVLLLFVSLEPFTIDLLMSTHSDNLPFGIYTGMLALTGTASFAVYWHSRRTPGLLGEAPSRETFLRECAGQLGLPLMTGLLCLASFWFERSDFLWCTAAAGGITFGGKRVALWAIERTARKGGLQGKPG